MNSNKKGFTIVEIVIALTIISIVTLTATSLVMVSQRISKSTRDRLLAVNLCNNSIAIFQSLNDNDSEELLENFKERFSKIYCQNETNELYFNEQNDNEFFIYFDNNWKHLNEDEQNNAKFVCLFAFDLNYNFVTFNIDVAYYETNYDVVSHGIIYSATYTMSLLEAKQ